MRFYSRRGERRRVLEINVNDASSERNEIKGPYQSLELGKLLPRIFLTGASVISVLEFRQKH